MIEGPVGAGGYPDVSVSGPGLVAGNVVGEQVERAAAREVEPGVVPVARKHAVLDGPPVQREAHMRATVVECEHPTLVVDHQHRPVAAAQDEPSPGLQLLEGARANEIGP